MAESDSAPICGACLQPCSLVHERRRRIVRARDCFDRQVWLDVHIHRIDCRHCGARVAEHISWIDRHARITRRWRRWVEVLVQILPIKRMADGFRDSVSFFLKIKDAFSGKARKKNPDRNPGFCLPSSR